MLKKLYQNVVKRTLVVFEPASLIIFESLVFITVEVGILVAIVLKKCIARPKRRLRNSKTNTPPQIWICQAFNLPAPFPIRIPLGFFVKGICGNILNHTIRLVTSGFLTAFFKNTLSRKIWREDIRKGCSVRSPQSP